MCEGERVYVYVGMCEGVCACRYVCGCEGVGMCEGVHRT